MIGAFILDTITLLIIWCIGYLIVRILLEDVHIFSHLGLAFPIGGGLLTWTTFMLMWFGIDQLSSIALFVSVGVLIILIFLSLREDTKSPFVRGKPFADLFNNRSLHTKLTLLTWTILGIIILSSFLISVGRSYSTWDAVAFYSIKGYGLAFENSIEESGMWGSMGFDYPLNIPLLVSYFKMMSNDILPGSKTIFPLYFVSLLFGCYGFWRKHAISKKISLLGVFFLATVPIVFEHSTIGYANLPLTSMLALALMAGIEGISFRKRNLQTISGVLFGLAVWTRPEGILFAVVSLVCLLGVFILMRQGTIHVSSLLLPLLIIGGSWLLFYSLNGGGDSQAMGGIRYALESIPAGNFRFSQAMLVLRSLIASPSRIGTWGLLFPIGVILIIAEFLRRPLSNHPAFLTVFVISVAFAVLAGMFFYIGQFQFDEGFLAGWLARSLDRTLLPSSVILGIAAITSLAEAGRVEDKSVIHKS